MTSSSSQNLDPLNSAAGTKAEAISSGRSIADSAAVLLLTRLAGVVLAWLLVLVLVRVLSEGDWESMSRFLTLITAFAIAQLGFPESVLYFSASANSGRSSIRLTTRTSALLGCAGVVLSLPFFFLPSLTTRVLGPDGEMALLPLAIFVTADLAFSPLPPLLLGNKHPRLAGILALGTRLPIALSAIVAIISGLGLRGALYGMAAGSILSLVLGWIVVLIILRGSEGKAPVVSFREQATYSIPVGLSRLVQITNVKLDKYIIMTVLPEAAFGTYYLGATEFPVPGMICSVVTVVMMADLVSLAKNPDRSGFLRLWHAGIKKITMITLPFFLFLMVFAEPIFVALYGEVHADAAIQFRIFQLLLLHRVTNYTNVSLALGQPRVPLVAAGIALSLNVVLAFILIQVLGIYGPAVANVIAIYLSTIYTMWAIREGLGVPWQSLFPLRHYLRTALVTILAMVPIAPLLVLDLFPWLKVGLSAILYLISYLALANVMQLVRSEDRAFLADIVRFRFLRQSQDPGVSA